VRDYMRQAKEAFQRQVRGVAGDWEWGGAGHAGGRHAGGPTGPEPPGPPPEGKGRGK
jgi:hypothetical protein